MTETIDQLAARFAKAAHESINQKRKYTGASYFEHPERVAAMVREVGGTPEMIAAAYLHDVVEDVPHDSLFQVVETLGFLWTIGIVPGDTERAVKVNIISSVFGSVVGQYVEQVTDVSKPSDGNRKTRKALDCDHLAKASQEAQTIKLADLIDNAKDIVANDPDFAKVYMREKAELLPVLVQGNAELWHRADLIVYHNR